MSTPSERNNARFGNRIKDAGTHVVKVAGFTCRDATTTITSVTVNDVVLDATAIAARGWFASGKTFLVGEVFFFPEDEEPTSITVGGATGSISVIVGG